MVFRATLEPGARGERAVLGGRGMERQRHPRPARRTWPAVEKEARAAVKVGGYRFARTPAPQRVEGEAD